MANFRVDDSLKETSLGNHPSPKVMIFVGRMWLTLVVAGVRQIVQAQGGASGERDRLFHSLRNILD